MRKSLLTLFCALCALSFIPNAAKANNVTVDNWNGTDPRNTTYLPIAINTGTKDNCAYHSVSQQLYYASELTSASSTTITAITFYYTSGTSFTRKLRVWMNSTDLDNFQVPEGGEPANMTPNMVNPGTKVFSGDVALTAGSTYTITFDTPYNWNGESNLIVTVFDSTGVKNNSTNYGATAAQGQTVMFGDAGKVRFLHKTNHLYADFANAGWTIANLAETTANSSSVGNRKYVNKITFTFEGAAVAPATPDDLAVSATTTTSASLSWSAVSGATSYDFQQSANGSDWSDLASGATGTSYNWTGLSAASTQYARIRATNAAGSSNWSDAVMVTTDAEHIHDGIIFNKWTSTTSLPTSGNYYINEDMNFEAYSTDVVTLTGDLNLCLNGKTVNMEAARIVVPSGMTLAIYDNVGGGKITSFVASEVGAFDIYAKALIAVYNGAELDLHQGIIENTYIPDEDGQSYAIYSNGTLRLSGDVLINSNDADIYLHESRVITLDGALTNAEKHTIYKNDGVITSGWSTYMSAADPRDYLESVNSAKSIYFNGTEAALQTLLTLSETALNSAINSNDGQIVDVNLTRPLVASQYNTFCLPFALTADQMEEYFGAGYELWELESSSLDGEQLSLAFERKYALEAGKPYLLQPASAISSVMFFDDMTIEKDLSNTVTSYVDFKGVYGTTSLEGGNRNLLFLGADNELLWPATTANIKGFRAYFEVKGGAAQAAKRARIVKKEEGATGMDQITNDKLPMTNKILRNGQLLIIRDGKQYNVLGIRL